MEFLTPVPVPSGEPKIGYNSGVLLVGSCFVEHIGRKLDYFKFRTLRNPFGILFHPAAIRDFLKAVATQREFSETDIFYHNETWHYFGAHSQLNGQEKEEILEKLNAGIKETRHFLKTASHSVITLGTSWAYRLKETGRLVANCHKISSTNFSKELMEVNEDLQEIIDLLKTINPELTVVFTISPVRHIKDGFIENQQSKARLISGVHAVLAKNPHSHYFPSYEIMMDELRDYRFYEKDMIHPNQVAIDHIWDKFRASWIDQEAYPVMKRVGEIQAGLLHRPFNENSEAHRKFLRDLEEKKAALEAAYPDIRFDGKSRR